VFQHPSEAEWLRFLRHELESGVASRMARHLELCERCLSVYVRLPPPVLYLCGRPVPPVIPPPAEELEAMVGRLLGLCQSRLPGGGSIVVAGDWRSEATLYTVLARVMGRLKRSGLTTAVLGSPFIEAKAPQRPKAHVTLLLEAPSYSALGPWLETWPGGVALLGGLAEEWIREPAFRIVEPSMAHVEEALASLRAEMRSALAGADRAKRIAAVAAGLGCDVPRAAFDTQEPPSWLVPVEGDAGSLWLAPRASWLAWDCLREWIVEDPGAAAGALSEACAGLPVLRPRLAARMRRRLAGFSSLRTSSLSGSML
jgi:hypothetical protein